LASAQQIVTDKFEKGKPLAELTQNELKEVSGIASSSKNSGMLWALNDSGNTAEIFLLDKQLKIKMACILKGIANRDWEDIAIGPGPDPSKSYVYVGEIGDNDAVYPYKNIYRFEEPEFREGNPEKKISTFDTITFRLSDRIKDTESLMIDPRSKNLYVVSKREDPVHVYEIKYPYSIHDTLTAVNILSLPFEKIVAANIDGKGNVLMKTYEHILFWENTQGVDLSSLLKKKPVHVPYEKEPKGEAITWAQDGSGFFTLGEQKKKESTYLYFYRLRK